MKLNGMYVFILCLTLTSCFMQKRGSDDVSLPKSNDAEKTLASQNENMQSILNIASLSVNTENYEKFFIGQKLDDDTIKKNNSIITTDLLGVKFGPIDGISRDDIIIAWNNQQRVVYIEILSKSMQTVDGFSIGTKKDNIRGNFKSRELLKLQPYI